MDQLKVILEYRFWVLSALAVLIPPIGWWVSTGNMATETDKRAKVIAGKVTAINSLTKDLSGAANKEWIDSATQVNVKLAGMVDQTHKRLYEHQRPVMVWWPLVRSRLDEAQVKYRGDVALNPQAFLIVRKLFISRYDEMWQTDVYQTVEPFDIIKGSGKVWCSDANGTIQITKAPVETWTQRQMITAEEMWDAQEDLWMLHALMKAVARVNEGSSSIDDARIKRLISATLRGGSKSDLDDRRKKKQTPAQAAGTGTAAQSSSPTFSGGRPGGGLTPNFGRSNVDTGPKPLPMIDPDDIFGSDETSSTMQVTKRSGGAEPSGGTGQRWFESDSKWRARAFVLRVVMDHQEIPKLLTVLTEAPFPVHIEQVEHQLYSNQKNRGQPSPTAQTENEGDQKQLKANLERLNLALNQSNLADVLVAGTFTFYNEPSIPTGQPSAAPSVAPAKGAQALKGETGAPPSSSKATQPATSGPPAGSAPKSPPSSKSGNASSGSGNPTQSPSVKTPTAPRTPAPATAKPAQPAKS
jgi:hypothetical protein